MHLFMLCATINLTFQNFFGSEQIRCLSDQNLANYILTEENTCCMLSNADHSTLMLNMLLQFCHTGCESEQEDGTGESDNDS